MSYPINGACQCGTITYRLLAPPKAVIACHCKECQKLSTSAFSLTAVVNASDVVFQGELAQWQRVADSGNTSVARFCPCCGNRMYHFNPDQPDTIKLKPVGLTDTRDIHPSMHVWVSEKQEWFDIPEGVKVFEKQP